MESIPQFLTIRQTAATGILPEHCLRDMAKHGQLPAIKVGNKLLINYDLFLDQLNSLKGCEPTE